MADTSYKRVLVLGSKKVGKTSLLSNISSREFDDEYYKTKKVMKFWDVKRRLEFVDTPGLDDKILELMPDDGSQALETEDDPQIQSYIKREDLPEISGYLIMYCDDPVTKHMAYQLFRVVTQVFDDGKIQKPIWVVYNEGSILRVKQVRRKDPEQGVKYYKDNLAEHFTVNVKTNKGIKALLESIAKGLASPVDLDKLFPQTSEMIQTQTSRSSCNGTCW